MPCSTGFVVTHTAVLGFGYGNPPGVRYSTLNNGMDLLGLKTERFKYWKSWNRSCWNCKTAVSIWWSIIKPTTTTNNRKWDGTSWTEVSDLIKQKWRTGRSFWLNLLTLSFAMEVNHSADKMQMNYWNGASWTEINDTSAAARWSQEGGTHLNMSCWICWWLESTR